MVEITTVSNLLAENKRIVNRELNWKGRFVIDSTFEFRSLEEQIDYFNL